MARIDYLSDKTGDLLIKNGDFVRGESDNQHIADLIVSAKGEWREFPLIGAEADRHIKSNSLESLKAAIIENLKTDGYQIKKVQINDDFSIDVDVFL